MCRRTRSRLGGSPGFVCKVPNCVRVPERQQTIPAPLPCNQTGALLKHVFCAQSSHGVPEKSSLELSLYEFVRGSLQWRAVDAQFSYSFSLGSLRSFFGTHAHRVSPFLSNSFRGYPICNTHTHAHNHRMPQKHPASSMIYVIESHRHSHSNVTPGDKERQESCFVLLPQRD